MQDVPEIKSQLDDKRFIEPVIGADLVHYLGGCAAHITGNSVGNITRCNMDEDKIEDQHSKK